MEYGAVNSPSGSQSMSSYSASSQYIDSNSEASSPSSPRIDMNNITFDNPLSFEMYSSTNNPSAFYAAQQGKIPIEFTGSSTLDEQDRRRRRTGSISSSRDKEMLPNMHMRRRAQNRASQRAFRERKERHVKGLEHQLEDLHEKHEDLLQSYSRKADEATKLNARIQELNLVIDTLRTSSELSFSDFLTPDKFDAVPGSDLYYSGPECYFNKSAVSLNPESTLSQLEDTL